MKKGFSIIELIVVIGIIAILMGVLITSLSGTTDTARAAKCLSNMRNLATAVQSYATANGYYPHAGSIESMGVDVSGGKSNVKKRYSEIRGWISWASQDVYPSEAHQSVTQISCYPNQGEGDDDLGRFALTNGALWKYVSGSQSIYTCPCHPKTFPKARWSYLMNAYFGWNAAEGYTYVSDGANGAEYGHLSKSPDRILLFGEIPFAKGSPGDWFPDSSSGETELDGVLQYKGCSKSPYVHGKARQDASPVEHVGANHKYGKYWYAHVVFADGHIEKLRADIEEDKLQELTTWLCTGVPVTFDGDKYEELD